MKLIQMITVFEYDKLTLGEKSAGKTLSRTDFEWLAERVTRTPDLSESFGTGGGAKEKSTAFVKWSGRETLSFCHYVGVIELPSGEQLEILPKIYRRAGNLDHQKSRDTLIRILRTVFPGYGQNSSPASVSSFPCTLPEWVIHNFLQELERLLRLGLRSAYSPVAREERFLRGQLDVARQSRQLPHRLHLFHCNYQNFSLLRPEHRLLRSATEICRRIAKDEELWRRALRCSEMLSGIPESTNIEGDFRQWKHGRLMTAYEQMEPWCRLVLGQEFPFAVAGEHRGLSFLFPMERLFEQYVACCLKRLLKPGFSLREQAAGKQLFTKESCKDVRNVNLRPDLLLEKDTEPKTLWVLDTKWKMINDEGKHSVHDLYQLFTYGSYYLKESERRNIALIYPLTEEGIAASCASPLCFARHDITLWTLFFDVDKGEFHNPPEELEEMFGTEDAASA